MFASNLLVRWAYTIHLVTSANSFRSSHTIQWNKRSSASSHFAVFRYIFHSQKYIRWGIMKNSSSTFNIPSLIHLGYTFYILKIQHLYIWNWEPQLKTCILLIWEYNCSFFKCNECCYSIFVRMLVEWFKLYELIPAF